MKQSKTSENTMIKSRNTFPVNKAKLKIIALAVLTTLNTHGMAAEEPSDGSALTTSTVETTHQIRDTELLVRIQQKIDADSREIDAMALRIKEMIRERHNTDAVNQQTSRQIEQLHAKLADLLADRQEAEKRLDMLLAEKHNLQRQVDALRDKRNDDRANLASLAGAAKERESAIMALGSDVDTARALVQDKQAKIAELANKLGNIQGKYDDAQARIAGLNSDLAKANDKADDLLAERSRLSGEIDLVQSQQGESNAALNSERDAHTDSLQELAAMKINLANAEQEIDALQSARDDLINDKSMLQASASDLGSRLKYLQAELDNRVIEVQAASSGFVNLEDKLGKTNAELEEVKEGLADADGRVRNLNAALAKLNSDHSLALKDNESLQAKIATFESDIAEKRRNNAELASSHKAEQARQAIVVAGLQDKIDALTDKNRKAENNRLALQSEYESRLKNIEQLNEQLAVLNNDKNSVSDKHRLLGAQLQKENKQKNKLQSALTALGKQNRSLGAERDALSALRDSLVNDVKNLKSKQQAIAAKRDEFSKQAKKLAASGEEQLDIIDRLDAHIASLEADADIVESTLASVTKLSRIETDKLRQQLAAKQNELDVSNDRLQALLLDNKNIESERNQLISDAEKLRRSLTDELAAAELNFVTVQKAREDSSIPLRLGSADFFATGSAELTDEGRNNLQKLADIIAKFEDRRIVVAGHTDSKKIGGRLKSRYFSNWELSVARAASAVRFMQHQSNIEPTNLSAAGYSEYFPVGDNESPEGRQMNRRVEVILYPRQEKEKFYSELEE